MGFLYFIATPPFDPAAVPGQKAMPQRRLLENPEEEQTRKQARLEERRKESANELATIDIGDILVHGYYSFCGFSQVVGKTKYGVHIRRIKSVIVEHKKDDRTNDYGYC